MAKETVRSMILRSHLLLAFLLFRFSDCQIQSVDFSELYYELNKILWQVKMDLPYPEEKKTCSSNLQCMTKSPNKICDRYFSPGANEGSFIFVGSYCVPLPIFDQAIELTAKPLEIGVRRCFNEQSCGMDEYCLVPILHSSGFCVRLNICAESKPATLITNVKYLPFAYWNCFAYTVSDGFRFIYLEDGMEYGSDTVQACCSENSGGTCTYGNITLPLKSCNENSDCYSSGHEPVEWCDENTRVCCSEQHTDRSIRCPDGILYPFIEPECENYNKNDPTSGICKMESVNATCLYGHCCPQAQYSQSGNTNSADNEFLLYKTTFESNVPCNPDKPLRRIPWAFCDNLTQRVVILNDSLYKQLETESEENCESNKDCEDEDMVCVFGSKHSELGRCTKNPLDFMHISGTLAYFLFFASILLATIFYLIAYWFERKM